MDASWRWGHGSGLVVDGEKSARWPQALLTAALFVVTLYLIKCVGDVQGWPLPQWALLAVLLLDSHRDRRPGTWLHFLPIGLAVLFFGFLLYYRAPWWWWTAVTWRNGALPHLWHWNAAFRSIPFHDGAWLRPAWLQTPWFTAFMRGVYIYCFPFAAFAPMIRSMFARDLRKMLSYTLSTYVLQFLLIIPFYVLISLDEVWWVLGHPDPLQPGNPRGAIEVENCFPSMHTSIAFAVLLLALRERGRLFKWVTVLYMSLIIYSTIFLEIHWLLDLAAGMLLAVGAIALSDRLLVYLAPRLQRWRLPLINLEPYLRK